MKIENVKLECNVRCERAKMEDAKTRQHENTKIRKRESVPGGAAYQDYPDLG